MYLRAASTCCDLRHEKLQVEKLERYFSHSNFLDGPIVGTRKSKLGDLDEVK